jgi:hypothetical protein
MKSTDRDMPPLLSGLKVLTQWFRTSAGRLSVFGVLALLAVVCIGAASLSYNELCFSSGRFLSNQVAVDAVVAEIIRQPTAQLITSGPNGTTFSSVQVVGYEDAAQFRQMNPDCCKIVAHNVGDEGPYTSVTQRLTGFAAKIVSVTYQLNYLDEGGVRRSAVKTEQAAVTNCGRPWHSQH